MLAGSSPGALRVEWCADYDARVGRDQQRRHDVYLIDYRLGARTGLELVREAFSTAPAPAPVIMLTGRTRLRDRSRSHVPRGHRLPRQAGTRPRPRSSGRSAMRSGTTGPTAPGPAARSATRWPSGGRATGSGIGISFETGSIFSPRWSAILGQSEQPDQSSPTTWFALVHPDDLTRLRVAHRCPPRRRHAASSVRAPDAPCRRTLALGTHPRRGHS